MMISLQSYVRQGRHTLRKWMADPNIHLWVRLGIHLLAGFCLSAASLNHMPQPLALGFLCACRGWMAVLSALGGCLGFLAFWGAAGYQGILWLLAGLFVVLLFGSLQSETPLLFPALSCFIAASAGVASQVLFADTTPVLMYLLRIALAGATSWVFSQVVNGRNPILEWIAGGFCVLALSQILPLPFLSLGFVAAGSFVVAGAFPGAVLAGLALDLAAVTPVSMTATMCLGFLVRFLPRYSRWMGAVSSAAAYMMVMSLSGQWDLYPLPGLILGGLVGLCLPAPTKIAHRRGETGVAQVRLEMAAGVLAQAEQLLLEAQRPPIDEDALVTQAAQRACAGCPCRKTCKDVKHIAQLNAALLHKPLLTSEELPIVCRKSGRFLAELHRSQERLRNIQADRERQGEYRAAVVQQFQFLANYLQDLSDQLSRRGNQSRAGFSPYTRIYGNRPREDNGDRCIMFPGPRCRYYVVLCDGMGTGLGAVQEGRNAGEILRRLLVAGYPAEHALRSLNSLCALRDQAGTATVDLVELELDTGRATLYKWGAAPSYLVTRLGADKVGVASPPPGLSVTDSREVVEKVSLRRGELLVLVSDGLGQEEVLRTCQNMAGAAPGEIGAALLAGSRLGTDDDATVVLIRLDSGTTVL